MESRTANTSSNNASATTIRKQVLAITGGDTYLGHCIAKYLLRESDRNGRDRHGDCRIRVLCRHEKDCSELRDLGAEIVETDYEDSKSLRRAFRDCQYAVFIPENTRNRVRHGECAIDAMEREDVRHVLMMSTIGAEAKDRELRHLCEFRELERYLEDKFTRGRWCIFRLDFFQQVFLLWAPMIEDERVLKMSTGRDGRFAAVNLNDVCRATYVTLTRGRRGDHGRDRNRPQTEAQSQIQPQGQAQGQRDSQGFRWEPLDERHHRRVYRLTGAEPLNGVETACTLSDAIGERDIQFKAVSRSEMRKELERLRDEDGDRHGRREEQAVGAVAQAAGVIAQVSGAVAQAASGRKGEGDNNERRDTGKENVNNDRRHDDKFRHRKPLRKHLNETKIETILDFFEYVKMGRADFSSGDLRDIIDEEPESLGQFFREHRDEFRGGNHDDEQRRQK